MATTMDFELKDVFDLYNQPSAEELRNQVIRARTAGQNGRRFAGASRPAQNPLTLVSHSA
jgi:hypothetical protein